MFLLSVAVLVLFVWVARLQRRVVELEARLAETPRAATPPPAVAPVVPLPPPPREARGDSPPAPAVATPPATTQPAVPPPPPAPPPLPRAPSPAPAIEWEALIGVKLFSWIAGIALALGGVFFLRYSIQNGWLQPPVRLAMGIAGGIALLVACETRWATRYAVTANALAAAGLVILFSSFYAAYALWELIGPLPAFAALVAVAAAAVLLSLRHDSLFVALLGLLGGFAAPALLSSGEDRPYTLFGYLLLLNAGLGIVAYRRRWAPLVALSLAFTTVYQWSWVFAFLSPDRLGLALGIFAAFPVLAWALLGWGERAGLEGPGDEERFRAMAGASAALPLLLVLYVAMAPGYGERFPLAFGFLFLVDAALLVIALRRGPRELHALGAAATLLVFLQWWTVNPEGVGGRWRAVLAFVALFAAFYLWAHRRARRSGRPLTGLAGRAALAAPALFFMFPGLALTEPGFASPGLPLAVLLGLLALVAVHAVAEADRLSYFVAGWLSVAWAVVWTARHARPEAPLEALIVDVVLACALVAMPLAARWRRDRSPLGGLELLALAPQALLVPMALQRPVALEPWPLLAAAAAMQVVASAASLGSRRGTLHLGAITLSSFVLMAWTLRAGAANAGFGAMTAAAALAALGLTWREIARWRRHPAPAGFDAAAAAALVLGQVVLAIAAAGRGRPGTAVVAAFHALMIVGLLGLAARADRLWLPLLGVIPAALAALALPATGGGLPPWAQPIAVALPVYALFLAYPLAIAPRLGTSLGPHLTAVAASLVFFPIAHDALSAGGYGAVLGLLPLLQAAALGVLLAALLRLEPPASRLASRVALVAAAVVAFVTIAVPVQFDGAWVTVGWAVEGVALAWVYTMARRRPLLWAALGLMAVSVSKGFLLDMARLGGLYRVASFVGLAVCLALAAVVLQRFVFARRE